MKVYTDAERLFRAAEGDVDEQKEEDLNRESLRLFKEALSMLESQNIRYDSLKFETWFRIGVLEHYFENQPAAHSAYLRAIALAGNNNIPDSLVFKPTLYLGIILYNEMKFDSALLVYKEAEMIADKYGSSLDETERLYNTLGAIYYETGDYRQAKNYLEKAISVLRTDNPSYKELLVNYKINLASTLTKLEEFDDAVKIYESVLPFNIHKDIILHNTGVIYLNLGSVQKALEYFRKVDPAFTNAIRLNNDMAIAYHNIHLPDTSLIYLQRAKALVKPMRRKSIPHGQTLKILGDVLLSLGKIDSALTNYQGAIIEFYSDFNERDIYKDPVEYSGLFSYINLFNALTAKADAFNELFNTKKRLPDLKASLNAYRSAFRLADYVEKSYTSDEARLFLNKIKYTVHSKPIDISLLLYELTNDIVYLEEAYFFDQHNKGSVISLSIQENDLKRRAGINDELSREEFTLRTAITRLSIKASQMQDSSAIADIRTMIRDQEILLGKVQEKMAQSSNINKPVERIPSVKDLQQLLDKKTALLSYHLSETHLLTLCITKKGFVHRKLSINDSFFRMIGSFSHSLKVMEQTNAESGKIQQRLYQYLIEPLINELGNASRLIIIPDDELHYLPFEVLTDASGEFLLARFSVQYQYAASLLISKDQIKGHDVLAIAPFNSGSYKDSTIDLTRLEHSNDEIAGLKGKALLDSAATKAAFILFARSYPIIHLATHAKANDKDPLRSFIAFYPERNRIDSIDHRLYAGEIYNLTLDSTRLVILSACETGSGELIRGEGLMSLTRAFAYAGCSNIITSLWKAEDRTTAFITKRLHHYLGENETMDVALQKAKLDFLESDDIDPRLKAPGYWSHLLFIGNYEKKGRSSLVFFIAGAVILLAILVAVIRHKRPRDKKQDTRYKRQINLKF